MEEDSGAVVLEVAEAACGALEGLNFAVKALGDRVCELMFDVGYDVFEVPLDPPGSLSQRRELTVGRAEKPPLKKAPRPGLGAVGIQFVEEFF